MGVLLALVSFFGWILWLLTLPGGARDVADLVVSITEHLHVPAVLVVWLVQVGLLVAAVVLVSPAVGQGFVRARYWLVRKRERTGEIRKRFPFAPSDEKETIRGLLDGPALLEFEPREGILTGKFVNVLEREPGRHGAHYAGRYLGELQAGTAGVFRDLIGTMDRERDKKRRERIEERVQNLNRDERVALWLFGQPHLDQGVTKLRNSSLRPVLQNLYNADILQYKPDVWDFDRVEHVCLSPDAIKPVEKHVLKKKACRFEVSIT